MYEQKGFIFFVLGREKHFFTQPYVNEFRNVVTLIVKKNLITQLLLPSESFLKYAIKKIIMHYVKSMNKGKLHKLRYIS